MTLNHWSGEIVDASLKVHSTLGPGLLESVYEVCLAHELRARGLVVQRQARLPIRFGDVTLRVGYRLDLVVNDAIVVEVKAVKRLRPIHQAQLLTYLKLSGHKVGLLINFNTVHLRDGIKRMANNA